jgi:hypothetical protein
MIAFGISITETDAYRRYAEPGIRRAAEPDSKIYAFAAAGTISRSYNLVLGEAGARPDLEALVLVHSYTEIADRALCGKVRQALSDPEVGVVGCIGATGVRSIAWWEGSVMSAPLVHRYGEHGGGELRAYDWASPVPAPGQVDTVDGLLMVLSPWAVRNVRFDEALALGHGFDLDYCLQVRVAGRKVTTADLSVIQHRSLALVPDVELWVEAHIRVAEKWNGRMPGESGTDIDWKARARRAEAEREAARAIAYSNRLVWDARLLEVERALEETTSTASWRLTKPLREANRWRREQRRRPRPTPSAPGGPRPLK